MKIKAYLGKKPADEIVLRVSGLPAPQGSKSFKGMRDRHAILAESSKAVKPWRREVEFQANHCGQVVLGPVFVEFYFYLPRPSGHHTPKGSRSAKYIDRPATQPDLSKLVRSTEDALVSGGVIEDDSKIVYSISRKYYADDRAPGADVIITRYHAA